MSYLRNLVLVSIIWSFSQLAIATDISLEQARKNIQENLKSIPADSIQPSEIKGLYKVFVPPRIFYVSADGLFAVDGSIIDLKGGVNLTEIEKQKSVITAVNSLGEDSMVVFAPMKTKHTVTVFTDIDCGYCRKLHDAVPEYNKLGIKIRYLAFPRAGLGSASYKKAVSVWCADDRKDAMTKAKSGKPLEAKSCDNPVKSHHNMGNMIGLRGTPAMVLEDGRVIPGFVPPARLNSVLGEPVAIK